MTDKALTWFLCGWVLALIAVNVVLVFILPNQSDAPLFRLGATAIDPGGIAWWLCDCVGALPAIGAYLLRDRLRAKRVRP
jgi:hypothetical protein